MSSFDLIRWECFLALLSFMLKGSLSPLRPQPTRKAVRQEISMGVGWEAEWKARQKAEGKCGNVPEEPPGMMIRTDA